MNKTHNPVVSLVGLILAAIIVLLTCSGCAAAAAAESPERFDFVHAEEYGNTKLKIITDTKTGVQYLVYIDGSRASNGRGVGITPLLTGEE